MKCQSQECSTGITTTTAIDGSEDAEAAEPPHTNHPQHQHPLPTIPSSPHPSSQRQPHLLQRHIPPQPPRHNPSTGVQEDQDERSQCDNMNEMSPVNPLPSESLATFVSVTSVEQQFSNNIPTIRIDDHDEAIPKKPIDPDDAAFNGNALDLKGPHFVTINDGTFAHPIHPPSRCTAAVCNPLTGKVEKELIHFNPDMPPIELGDLVVDKNRLFAGYLNGGMGMASNVLSKNSATQIRTFDGFHHGPVTRVGCVSSQPNVVLSGGVDGEVRIWNVSSGKSVAICCGNELAITSLAMDPKQFVVAGTSEGKVIIWEIDAALSKQISLSAGGTSTPPSSGPPQQLQPKHTFEHGTPPNSPIRLQTAVTMILLDIQLSVAVTLSECEGSPPDFAPYSLRIWNIQERREARIRIGTNRGAEGHGACITAVQWDRLISGPTDRKTSILVTGDAVGRVCLWELSDTDLLSTALLQKHPTPLRTIQAHPSAISTLQMDPFKLTTGSVTGSLKVFDITTFAQLQSLSLRKGAEVGAVHGQDRRSISFLWGGEWKLIAVANGSVRCWDFRNGGGNGVSVSGVGKAKRRSARHRFDVARVAQRGGGGGGVNGAGRVISPKARVHDIRSELREYEEEVRAERRTEERREREERRVAERVNGVGSGRLSEEELLHYAIMISMEGHSSGIASAANGNQGGYGEEEAMKIARGLSLSELEHPGVAGSSTSASARSSQVSLSASQRNSESRRRSAAFGGGRSSGAWYEDDWDFDRDYYASLEEEDSMDPAAARHLVSMDAQSNFARREFSLTIPLTPLPPTEGGTSTTPVPFSTPLSYASAAAASSNRRERRGSTSSSSLSSSAGSAHALNDWSDDEDSASGPASTPSGKQKYVFGSLGSLSSTSPMMNGAPLLLRSPRLGPLGTHVSPRLGPQVGLGQGVVVAPRATREDEDEEMMYVLELSLLEK
ncbi:hypothetical protein HDU97_004944 [Phlyctochytrium planicorne]|nr:hypothetical protein HDU97_004944 [Phlyctochytrium planicorne]